MIPAILVVDICVVGNSVGAPKENVVVLIVPDDALRFFLSKKYVGELSDTYDTVTVVGSSELETAKSIGSSIINLTEELLVEVICVFESTYKA